MSPIRACGAGGTVSVTGRLTRPDAQAAISGAPVQLYGRPDGSATWSLVGTTTSSSTGNVSLTQAPSASTEYQWIYPGSTDYTGAGSSTQVVRVRQK